MCAVQSVAADEPCEAAFGLVRHCEAAAVKPDTADVQINPGLRFYGRFATGRSLARLDSCYERFAVKSRSRRKRVIEVLQLNRVLWVYDRFAIGRSLAALLSDYRPDKTMSTCCAASSSILSWRNPPITCSPTGNSPCPRGNGMLI